MNAAVLLAAAISTTPLGLGDWISLARENSPVVSRGEAGLLEAEASWGEARSSLLPSLTLSASAGHSWTSQTGLTGAGDYDQASYSAGLTLSQEIISPGGSSWISLEAAEVGQEQAKVEYGADLLELEADIAEAYYSAVEAVRLQAASQAALYRSTAVCERTELMYDLGAADSLELMSARMGQTEDRIGLLQDRQGADRALSLLWQTAGLSGDTALSVDTAAAIEPLAAADVAVLPRSTTGNHSIASATLSMERAELSLTAAERQWMPSVTASGSWSWSDDETDFGEVLDNDSWSVGIGLSMPLFDGWRNANQAQSARASLLTTEALLKETRDAAATELETAMDRLTSSLESLELAQLQLEYAREKWQLSRLSWEMGNLEISELLEAQAELASAEAGLISARTDCLTAEVEYLALVGMSPRVGA